MCLTVRDSWVRIQGREIGIFNVDGNLHAVLNRCPHRGGELCKGDVLGFVNAERPGEVRLDATVKFIVCPWHGWEFDIETGESWYEGPRDIKARRRYRDARQFGLEVKRGSEVADGLASGTAQAGVANEAAFIDSRTHRVKGPYTAEIFPVSQDEEYVILSLRRLSALSGHAGDAYADRDHRKPDVTN